MNTIEEVIQRGLVKECTFKTARAGGAGGQNVNKVETKVELWFDIKESENLSNAEKELLLLKLSKKIEKDSFIHLQDQSKRTQLENKNLVKLKFFKLIASAFKIVKLRKPTKISKTAKLKRETNKKLASDKKTLRKKLISVLILVFSIIIY